MALNDVIWFLSLIVLSLTLLCIVSHVAKFYLKLICYYVAIFTVTAVAIPFCLLHPKDPGNLLYASWMVRHIISKIFGLKWDVKNPDLLKSDKPYVMVCNHQSALDIIGMMYIWPLFHPCVPVLKKELLFTGPFGIFCWLAGCVFVDRFNSKKARDTLNLKIKDINGRKIKLWVFPEGTRNDKGILLPFKKGAFHIATQAKIPIVPVVFSTYSDFYNIGKKIFDSGTIIVTVLPWIDTTSFTPEDVPTLSEDIRESMIKCLSEPLLAKETGKLHNGSLKQEHH